MSSTPKVAIIGLGNIGKTIAQNTIKCNRSVFIASREATDAKEFAMELGSLATATSTSDAIKNADIIVLSVWFNTIHDLFQEFGNELQGKIIIDPSNPIAPDENGGFKKIIGDKESAGQLNAAIIPRGAKLVKAFGTLGAGSLAAAAYQSPEKAVLFYASDDATVDGQVEDFIHDNGFEAVKVGGLDQSIRIEVFGDLHEFGALGKTVTKIEALSKL